MNRRLHLSKQYVLPIVLTLLLVLVLSYVQLSPFGIRPARAATRLAIGSLPLNAVPAAAIDDQVNRYVFWRGADASHGLWEGFYQASIITWHGPINIPGMGPLGSEPTVAVDPYYVSPEYDYQYAYQFVFWQGADTHHNLWEAYWDGSWHGPINLGMGSLGSKPGATYDAYKGILTVAWKGMDGNLWYAYNSLSFGQQQSWRGPFSAGWGTLGGPPTVADAGSGEVQAFWRGNDGYLWHGTLQAGGSPVFGPGQLPQSGVLGSDPSATGVITANGVESYAVSWAGLDRGLWSIDWAPNSSNPAGSVSPSPTDFPKMGPLGSAPGCIYQLTPPPYGFYCYWAGADASHALWEMSPAAGPTNWGMGPLE